MPPGLRILLPSLWALAVVVAACGGGERTAVPTITQQVRASPSPTLTLATATPAQPAAAPSPTTSRRQQPTASPSQPPLYDSSSGSCLGIPSPTIDREWQVVAPRGIPGPVRPGEVVEVGLRNKFGAPDENYYAGARIIAPDGTSFVGTTFINADNWGILLYPDDFVGAVPLSSGVYTVVWEIQGGFIACDGFVVEAY